VVENRFSNKLGLEMLGTRKTHSSKCGLMAITMAQIRKKSP